MQISGLSNIQQLNPASVLDILGRLNVGDVIKAKVLEMTSGELMLKLFDGTVFRATVAADVDARPGELLELAVSGKNDGTITLETVKKNFKSESFQNEVKKLLIGMDIAPEPENIALAGEFRAAGEKLLPDVFKKASELIGRFRELTPEKAVFLASRDIRPEEGRTDNLVRLLEGRLKLGRQLDELQNIISSLSKTAQPDADTKSSAAAAGASFPAGPRASAPEAGLPDRAVQAGRAGQEAANRQETGSLNAKTGTPALMPDGSDGAASSALLPQTETKAAGFTPRTTSNTGTDGQPGSKPPVSAANVPLPEAVKIEAVNVERQSAVRTDEQDGLKLLITDEQDGLKLLKSEAGGLEKLKDAFKSIFVRTDSDNLKSELEVKKLYKDIAEKLDTIKNTAAGSGMPAADEIASRVNNLEDGLKLLNQINNSTAYYQLPLNISGFNTTGELYVMKREQRRKRIDPRDVTMFISLDTQNIGRIETVIDIKGRNVGMNLRAQEQTIIDFIKENFKHLYNGLAEKGYRLVDIKYRLMENETSPVGMDRLIRKELGEGRNSLDVRI